jgi:hypothetical protein
MPKLGESILEGTITKWFVKEGDTIEEDDMLFEVATDKVDSEIPSPVDGVVSKILSWRRFTYSGRRNCCSYYLEGEEPLKQKKPRMLILPKNLQKRL